MALGLSYIGIGRRDKGARTLLVDINITTHIRINREEIVGPVASITLGDDGDLLWILYQKRIRSRLRLD